MKDWKKKPRPSKIGRRTGTDVLQGKSVRRRDDGTDVFDDYWTDGDSVRSDETTQSIGTPNRNKSKRPPRNVSTLDSGDVSPVKLLRSSLGKTLNQRSGVYDYGGDSSPERSRRAVFSKRKSLHSPENVTNARSKLTQTSLLLDETKRSVSRTRTSFKEFEINKDGSSDSNESFPITKSPGVLSNSSAQNGMKDLSLSEDDINAAIVSLSHEMESGKKLIGKSYPMGDETEGSLSKNGAYTKTYRLRETGGKKDDSSGNEKISTVGRSPRVLSNTSSLPNSREKGDQRISSGGRSPQYAAKASEVLQVEENIPSRGNKSINRSAILVSPGKESKRKEDKRKSSLGKSPIAVKRKIQAPNTLENSLSKTPRVQNRGGDSNKRNSSGGRSQHADKSSEVLNRKEVMPSRSDKIVNRSEILASSRKKPDQMSSIEKSPRTSKSNMVQVSNSPLRKSLYVTRKSSSLGKSPIAVRRSRSSRVLSNTSSSSNSSEKGNQMNSSGGRSPRSAAKFFKVLELKEIIPSRSDKSVNRSKILASSQKENDQLSSIEKSPRTSEHNIVQVSNSPLGKSSIAVGSSRSPRVLSDTSSSPNSSEKGNQRNSSGGRSPLYAAKSSKENIPSKSNKSVNGSKILTPTQKENDQMSSLVKSPRTSKRNMMQVSNSPLEKSAIAVPEPKSPRVLPNTSSSPNSSEQDNQRNSSGGKSPQYAAKSSKENIPSRSDKSVNGSEILASSQKENDQMSSIEKSPRTSERNMMQVSNSSGSQMKAVSPMQSVRRQIVFGETAKDVDRGKKQSPYSVRRSSRMRFPPLASWRNERPKFEISISGEMKCVGVDKGQPEDDYAFKSIRKKRELYKKEKIQELKKSKRKKQKSISKLIGRTAISDANSGKTIELNLHRPFSTCEWTLPMDEDSPGYMISQVFSSHLLTFGFLDIAGHSMKEKRFSPSNNSHFVVVKGVVDTVINATSFTFRRGDSFIVPSGTMYCISNNNSSSALLHFCTFKIPFFRYQEDV